MDIQHLIIFCGIQVLGLQLILLKKKFRTLPNLMLMLILINIVAHYIYYYFFYTGRISYASDSAYLIVPFAALAPPIVYYYVISVIYGRLAFNRKSLLHLLPLIVIGLIYIPFKLSEANKQSFLYLAKGLTISLYLIYPFIMLKTLAGFYHQKGISFKLFEYNKKKTSLIRLLILMMLIHFSILASKYTIPLFVTGAEKITDIINLCFLMTLGYAISYVIINEPRALLQDKKIGLGGFKNYEKSRLTRTKAEAIVKTLNHLMEAEQLYLNSEFDLPQLSALSKISTHEISETLNGLVGQSFNDYVNNYRVEEFKKLAIKEDYKNYTILALAYEAGFKSKATFNAAFKKFTGITPSQYLSKSK